MLLLVEESERGSEEVEKLLFHPHCGAHAAVIANGKTAHRPNAVDDFNNGVVLTARPLLPNEMFEVDNSETSLCVIANQFLFTHLRAYTYPVYIRYFCAYNQGSVG